MALAFISVFSFSVSSALSIFSQLCQVLINPGTLLSRRFFFGSSGKASSIFAS
jgi:hypothetical protein